VLKRYYFITKFRENRSDLSTRDAQTTHRTRCSQKPAIVLLFFIFGREGGLRRRAGDVEHETGRSSNISLTS
jgi:hypothetical protein